MILTDGDFVTDWQSLNCPSVSHSPPPPFKSYFWHSQIRSTLMLLLAIVSVNASFSSSFFRVMTTSVTERFGKNLKNWNNNFNGGHSL